MSEIHLWDVDHPYYCNEGNHFAAGCGDHFRSWLEFAESTDDQDLDMNLVFRWDWQAPRKDGDPGNPVDWHGDEYYRDSILKVFYMGQRKGIYRWVTVEVCRADEPAVREWLQKRFDHMLKLWEPFTV